MNFIGTKSMYIDTWITKVYSYFYSINVFADVDVPYAGQII